MSKARWLTYALVMSELEVLFVVFGLWLRWLVEGVVVSLQFMFGSCAMSSHFFIVKNTKPIRVALKG